ncbi:MAG: DUF7144 family membrane protein, partial [Micromonosporaceae bacterium]
FMVLAALFFGAALAAWSPFLLDWILHGDRSGHIQSLILGAVLFLAGLGIFAGNLFARSVGILAAGLSAVANFMWIPYYPVWAIVVLTLDVFVIWALSTSDLGKA